MSKNEPTSEIPFNILKETEDKHFLIILVGIPASGKSVFAHQFKSYLIEKGLNEQSISIIDTDQIRTELYGEEFNPDNESTVVHEKYKIIDELAALPNVRFIIVDDLNYLTSQRKMLHNIANQHGLIPLVIFFDCPLEIALKNNENRAEKCVPDYVIKRIYSKLDTPGKKYAWDKFNYLYDCKSGIPYNETFEDIIIIMKMLIESKNHHFKPVIKPSMSNESSNKHLFDYHQIDLVTRKILTEIIQNRRDKRGISKDLIVGREEITESFHGEFSPDDAVGLNKIRQEFLLHVKQDNLIDSIDSELAIKQLFLEFCEKYGRRK